MPKVARRTAGGPIAKPDGLRQIQLLGIRGVRAGGEPEVRGVVAGPSGGLRIEATVLSAVASTPSGAAGGDLSDTYPNPTVISGVHLNPATVPNSALQSSVALRTDKLSAFAATTSAELAGVLTDETGTGPAVFANSPALVTPALGTPLSGDLRNCTNAPRLVGEMILWSASSTPALCLDCDGAAVSRTTYAALFAVIGTTWGAGDASTTFNVPDMRNQVPIGAGSTYSVAQAVGAATVTLDVTQIPEHSHGGSTGSAGVHDHGGSTASQDTNANANTDTYDKNLDGSAGTVVTSITATGHSHTISSEGNHSHSISAEGGGAAHNNIQPSKGVKYLIYAGV